MSKEYTLIRALADGTICSDQLYGASIVGQANGILKERDDLQTENAALRTAADNMKAERDYLQGAFDDREREMWKAIKKAEALRAMCDELAEALDQELNFRGDASDFDLDKGFNALARYRAMTATEKEGE